MSILGWAAEDLEFPNGVSVQTSGDSGNRRTTAPVCSRCAVSPTVNNAFIKSILFPAGGITAGWLTGQVRFRYLDNSYAGFGLGASGTNKAILIGVDSSGHVTVGTFDGSTFTVLATGTSVVWAQYGSLNRVDLQLINYGATGELKVYINQASTPEVDYSGNISISGVASFDSIFFKGQAGESWISECLVADADTRTKYLRTNNPNGAGDTNEWNGAYTDIDETTNDDGDNANVNEAAKDCLVALADSPAGTYGIEAVMISVRAGRSADSVPTQLSIGIKSGTIDVDAPADPGVDAYATRIRSMPVNPVTVARFTPAEVDALQLVLRSVA